LLDFLQRDVAKRCQEEGLDSEINFQQPLAEIIDEYQHLFGVRTSIPVEKVLMDAFPLADFTDQGLARYYPRMYRGLPRLYHRESPMAARIQKHFTYLPSLKKQAVSRALFSLYSQVPVRGMLSLFAWAATAADYMVACDALRTLQARFPELEIHFIVLAPAKMHLPLATGIFYDQDCPVDSIPADVLNCLRASDLIVQMPAYYLHTQQLLEALEKIESSDPMPRMEWMGTGIESPGCHPQSGGYAMGLHFLEKGLWIRKLKQAAWTQVKNEQLKTGRHPENLFYLAHLSTATGGAIYLHALLKSLENDARDIDLCVPDLSWFIHYVEKQEKGGKPLLEWELGVAAIEIHFEGRYCSLPLSASGKRVRLLCPKSLTPSDLQALFTLSGDFAAVSDLSLVEAISMGKPFFYDGSAHSLLKDLVALAENRIGDCPQALACIRGMKQSVLYRLPVQEGEWVDETFFQEREEWTAIALSMGLALQDADVSHGFKKLAQIVAAEFSANTFLCHLVQRGFCHRQFPRIAEQETQELALFTSRFQTFAQLIQRVRGLI
jgi:hypothetical protein